MDEHSRVSISIRLARTNDDLAATQDLIDPGRYRIAAGRAYDAVFTVTTTVPSTSGICAR